MIAASIELDTHARGRVALTPTWSSSSSSSLALEEEPAATRDVLALRDILLSRVHAMQWWRADGACSGQHCVYGQHRGFRDPRAARPGLMIFLIHCNDSDTRDRGHEWRIRQQGRDGYMRNVFGEFASGNHKYILMHTSSNATNQTDSAKGGGCSIV